MLTGSGHSLVSKARGPTFHRSAIAKRRSASALICIARVIWSNGSSTESSSVGASPRGMTSWRPTTSLLSSSHQSVFGCVFMSPRPSEVRTGHAGLRRFQRSKKKVLRLTTRRDLAVGQPNALPPSLRDVLMEIFTTRLIRPRQYPSILANGAGALWRNSKAILLRNSSFA